MTVDQTAHQPTVVTDRFELRAPRKSDAGLISHYTGDLRVASMTRTIPHPLPPGSTEALIARALAPIRDSDVWVIDATKVDGPEVMGLILLDKLDRNQSEIGYWVAPPFWNTGLASDAVRALIEANPLDNDTMFASVFQDNQASARVLTNCGFDYIGDAEAFCVSRNATLPTWTYIKKLR